MTRSPRANGEFLHVVVRGIGQQILFEEDADRSYYLNHLARFCEETQVSLLAYCLMGNHVHLLVQDTKGNVSNLMKKVGVSYAGYYNKKYLRSGHLFQDRFKSETISNEQYLISVFRYILKNPEKAGICPASEYRWSSYSDYEAGRRKAPGITSTEFMRGVMSEFGGFEQVMAQADGDEHLEADRPARDDGWALAMVKETLGCKSGTELQSLPRNERNEALRRLKAAGLSVRQISRVTGINRGVVQKA